MRFAVTGRPGRASATDRLVLPTRHARTYLVSALQLTDSVVGAPISILQSKQISNRTSPLASMVKVAAMSGSDSLSDRNSCALGAGIIATAYFSPLRITPAQTSQERTLSFSTSAFTLSQRARTLRLRKSFEDILSARFLRELRRLRKVSRQMRPSSNEAVHLYARRKCGRAAAWHRTPAIAPLAVAVVRRCRRGHARARPRETAGMQQEPFAYG